MVYIADIPFKQNNNCFLFKNKIKYARVEFMQISKILKKSIDMFFNNPNLAPIQQHLSYTNIDKIRMLLTKLPYNKVIW